MAKQKLDHALVTAEANSMQAREQKSVDADILDASDRTDWDTLIVMAESKLRKRQRDAAGTARSAATAAERAERETRVKVEQDSFMAHAKTASVALATALGAPEFARRVTVKLVWSVADRVWTPDNSMSGSGARDAHSLEEKQRVHSVLATLVNEAVALDLPVESEGSARFLSISAGTKQYRVVDGAETVTRTPDPVTKNAQSIWKAAEAAANHLAKTERRIDTKIVLSHDVSEDTALDVLEAFVNSELD